MKQKHTKYTQMHLQGKTKLRTWENFNDTECCSVTSW